MAATPALLSLPDEILFSIIDQLAEILRKETCSTKKSPSLTYFRGWFLHHPSKSALGVATFQGLQPLSNTCRRLHHFLKPYLYRDLDLGDGGVGREDMLADCVDLSFNLKTHIQSLHLWWYSSSYNGTSRLMFLPNLKDLYLSKEVNRCTGIWRIRSGEEDGDEDVSGIRSDSACKVQRIQLNSFNPNDPFLPRLLGCPARLTMVYLHLREKFRDGPGTWSLDLPLFLERHKTSLQVLVLTWFPSRRWGQSKTFRAPLDFSGFISMKVFKCCRCFVSYHDNSARVFYKTLPLSLEHLEILYEEPFQLCVAEDLQTSPWLLLVVQNKIKQVPMLQEVSIHSTEMYRDESGNSIDKHALGVPPAELAQAFGDSRATLKIFLNTPELYY